MTDALLAKADRMEQLSRAYVAAIAAHAGYVTATNDLDRDSIDVTIRAGDLMRPAIDIQLKATGRIPAKAAAFSFPLSIKNYNDLRIRTQTPRILVVLAMPQPQCPAAYSEAVRLLEIASRHA